MSDRIDINAIVKQVQSWSPESREALAIELLDSAPAHPRAPLRVEDIIGLAHGDCPTPDDAQVKLWIDEHRMEKYGR